MQALDLQAIRRQMREAHPQEAAELIRQVLGLVEARRSRLEADMESLAYRWRIREWRLGRHPSPEEEPCPNAEDEKAANDYRRGARAAAAIEIVLAVVLGLLVALGSVRFLIAIGSGLLAVSLIAIAEPSVRAKLFDEHHPQETRNRLRIAMWRVLIAAGVSLLPLFLLLRGGGGRSIELAISLSWLPLTASLSALSGIFAMLAVCHDDLLARDSRRAVDEGTRLVLFREELVRLMDELPLRPVRNGRNGRRKVAIGCLAALLLAAHPCLAFTSIEVLVDSTGSADRIALERTSAMLSASLPHIVQTLGIEQLAVAGWGAATVWLPPDHSVSFPPQSCWSEEKGPSDTSLSQYFSAYARAAEEERAKRDTAAEALRSRAIQNGCDDIRQEIGRLARAGIAPEKECSPVSELLLRCSASQAKTLTIVLTDAIGCAGQLFIPRTSSGKTLLIIVPGKSGSGRSIGERVPSLSAPWLRAIPSSILDPRGDWFESATSGWADSTLSKSREDTQP